MNAFAKFDEIPLMTLQDIKETKRYGEYKETYETFMTLAIRMLVVPIMSLIGTTVVWIRGVICMIGILRRKITMYFAFNGQRRHFYCVKLL